MDAEDISYHLIEMSDSIKRFVSSYSKNKYFGVYDKDDLFQEVYMRLWVCVPKNFDSEKSGLYSYVKKIMINLLMKISNKEYKNVSLNSIDIDNYLDIDCDIQDESIIQDDRKIFYMRLSIEDLSKIYRHMEIVNMLFKSDFDRQRLELDYDVNQNQIQYSLNKVKKIKNLKEQII